MKKLLFLFMLLLSLCACSSDDGDKEIQNVISIDGKAYPIDRVILGDREVFFYSARHELYIGNVDIVRGKKSYLVDYNSVESDFTETDEDGSPIWNGKRPLYAKDIDKSSYVYTRANEDDTQTYIEAYIKTANHLYTATYSGIPQKY